eukprot:scaffold982_cov99-Isochrysis_galbana.AAC.3
MRERVPPLNSESGTGSVVLVGLPGLRARREEVRIKRRSVGVGLGLAPAPKFGAPQKRKEKHLGEHARSKVTYKYGTNCVQVTPTINSRTRTRQRNLVVEHMATKLKHLPSKVITTPDSSR